MFVNCEPANKGGTGKWRERGWRAFNCRLGGAKTRPRHLVAGASVAVAFGAPSGVAYSADDAGLFFSAKARSKRSIRRC